ncbi:FAD:protein FMN transferase [Rhodanobacter aciditrophus]|uniref:FAD:protein FMN transferase n=1 Tax=Rhodanobacter aciditrophus TaxID=1623218 RepID=A0ABW4B1D9_9GAMM
MIQHTLKVSSSANPSRHPAPTIEFSEFTKVSFQCMASPCEILLDINEADESEITELCLSAVLEAWRIEYKYSRYQDTNTWHELHNHPDTPQIIDSETQSLMAFAYQAWQLSDGRFDITSGLLRNVWSFKHKSLPSQTKIDSLLAHIGFDKLIWHPEDPSFLTVPSGMELDFGGIGKEYAVDRVLHLIDQQLKQRNLTYRVLVNFGGDLACRQNLKHPIPWQIGIESLTQENRSDISILLSQGAIATSGDTKRYITIHDKRYGHILNPKTGWPIQSPYRSISVAADSCVQAGMLATFTLLQGHDAKTFISQTGLDYWLRTEQKTYTNR